MKNSIKTIATAAIILALAAETKRLNAQTNGTTGSWDLKGNSNIDPAVNFIGTTTNHALKFKTNNGVKMTLSTTGKLCFGTSTSVFRLDVKSGSINTDSLYRIGGVQVLTRDASNKIQIGDNTAYAGIGTAVPEAPLHIASGESASLTSDGYLMNGLKTGVNLVIDNNEIQTRDNGIASTLLINNDGGNVNVCNNNTGTIGLGTSPGTSKVTIYGPNNTATESTPGLLQIGLDGSKNVNFDNNQIQARDNFTASQLLINPHGGDVAIGHNNPAASKVHISGGSDATLSSGTGLLLLGSISNANLVFDNNEIMARNSGASSNLYLNALGGDIIMSGSGTGKVGIGVSNPTYRLEVCGTIRAKEVRVETGWCDYVFNDDYQLRPLEEVSRFITSNKHLPDVTPGPEIENNGLEVGKVSSQMIRKIEELTLYVIQLDKQNKDLKKEIDLLKK